MKTTSKTLMMTAVLAFFTACGDKEETVNHTPGTQDTTGNVSQDTIPNDTIHQDTTSRRIEDNCADYTTHEFEYFPLEEYLIGTWVLPDNCGPAPNLDGPRGYGIWDSVYIRYGIPCNDCLYTSRLVFDEDSAFIEHPQWFAYPSTKSAWYVVDSLRIKFRKKDGSDSIFTNLRFGNVYIYPWTRDTMVIGYVSYPGELNIFVRQMVQK